MNAADQIEMYPYTYIYKGESNIIVWQSNKQEKDNFKLDSNRCLVLAKTENELKSILGTQANSVRWDEGAEIDIDRFWKTLRNLRTDRSSAKKTCEILLEGWNFIEDLARTFELDEETNKLRSPLLKKIYEKLYFGNNLPAVTPEGKSYSPVWLQDEITLFRKEILSIWKSLEVKLTTRCVSP